MKNTFSLFHVLPTVVMLEVLSVQILWTFHDLFNLPIMLYWVIFVLLKIEECIVQVQEFKQSVPK